MMPSSLQGIAKKAALHKTYRFRSLLRMLTVDFLMWCWSSINKNAATGIDQVDAKAFEADLQQNVETLLEQLKSKCYRVKLILRIYIPKGSYKMRPLGILTVGDKLLQMGVTKILEVIYEQDFLPCSYGYRLGRGAKDAINELYEQLRSGGYNYIIEADIRAYFDSINHEMLVEMLKLRIDDNSFIRLIQKWLKAGILEIDGQVIHPVMGTPQGGIISPILANIYLHYVLDMWFEEQVKPNCYGRVYLSRYADDFVCAFEYEKDAQRFYAVLGKRLGKFNLQLAEDKTRLIQFNRHVGSKNRFDFLGFEFSWGKGCNKRIILKKRTAPKRLRASIVNFAKWCKKNRHKRIRTLFKEINWKLKGYYNYYGLRGNYKALSTFFHFAKRNLFKWLNRRSQKKSYNWQQFNDVMKHFELAKPRIVESTIKQFTFGF